MVWFLFSDAKSTDAAKKVLRRVTDHLGVSADAATVEAYHKGGYKLSFSSPVVGERWPDVVFQTLTIAQKLGRDWSIFGDIADEVDAWSNETVISGVRSAHVVVLQDRSV